MAFSLSEETKERIVRIQEASQVIFRYGFIPLIIYLGWSQTSPRPSLISLISPLPIRNV
ncbi:TOM7 family-domain-containing protein [Limtongia smithiae]|uniref:TOM7 family-domain-containing protein n=1 Tax=Limtongia smithiae TaxID=1125753 RepID=UPI0034CE8C84